MKSIIILFGCVLALQMSAQVVLNADGPGDTYELITSVLAPENNPIEVPDCNHEAFGDHIEEIFDEDLNAFVFRFHMHTTPDNDRCINFDRQRNEIKSYDKSPDNLLGIENEKVIYKWKFKLTSGFQASPNFTHLHQLKSVGGNLASMPMYTLTARKGSPDKLELRYAQTDNQITLIKEDLDPFVGSWLDVTETIKYGTAGTYSIEITRVEDNEVLLAYANDNIINWRPDASFVRPKWGIYRSLLNAQDLRDEAVLFANFSVEEILVSSNEHLKLNSFKPIVNVLSGMGRVEISNLPKDEISIKLYDMQGRMLLREDVRSQSRRRLDVSSSPIGTYLISIETEQQNYSQLIYLF